MNKLTAKQKSLLRELAETGTPLNTAGGATSIATHMVVQQVQWPHEGHDIQAVFKEADKDLAAGERAIKRAREIVRELSQEF